MTTPKPLAMLVTIDTALDPLRLGDVVEADSYTELIEAFIPGYKTLDGPGATILRMKQACITGATIQAMFAQGRDGLPDWFWDRNLSAPLDLDVWDGEVPLVVVADAQEDLGVPEGRVVVLTVANEKLFIESLARAGVIELYTCVGADDDLGEDTE